VQLPLYVAGSAYVLRTSHKLCITYLGYEYGELGRLRMPEE
jgi:hypothetical protein